MRTSSAILLAIAVAVPLGAASAFELNAITADTPPADAFRFGIASYRAGDAQTAVEALSYAAEKGSTGALWKLGRMYADGDGVERDEVRAYQLLSEVADAGLSDDDPDRPRRVPYVLDAMVRIGSIIARGIPDSDIKADPTRARGYYERAAVYGNADAQFRLARMYHLGEGGRRDAHQAAKWAKLSMDKGHNGARALLGHLLFEGDGVTRQPLRGLTFLTIALRLTGPGDTVIHSLHEQALSVATEAVWNQARLDAEAWLAANTVRETAELAPLTQ